MRNARPEDWAERAYPHVYSGTVDGKHALAIFNFSDQPNRYVLARYGMQGKCRELLHPIGCVSEEVVVPGHDAVLIANDN